MIRIRSPAKKTFGEAFGAATGVSDPRLQKKPDTKRRCRRPSRHCSWARWPRLSQLACGPHPSRQWLRRRQFVSGSLPRQKDVRRGVRRCDRGQRPQLQKKPDTKPVIRSRFPAKKTFGETFGAATGVSDPSYRRNRIRSRFFVSGSLLKRRSVPRPAATEEPETTASGPSGHKKAGFPIREIRL